MRPSQAQWLAWGRDPCTQQVVETMRRARDARRAQERELQGQRRLADAAMMGAEANVVDELLEALEAQAGVELGRLVQS